MLSQSHRSWEPSRRQEYCLQGLWPCLYLALQYLGLCREQSWLCLWQCGEHLGLWRWRLGAGWWVFLDLLLRHHLLPGYLLRLLFHVLARHSLGFNQTRSVD
jgi:hypothetical protein